MYPSIKAQLSAVLITCGAFTSAAQAASVAFNANATRVTGISFSEPITFTATEAYSSSKIQIRIYDLFPTGTVYGNSMVGSGLAMSVGSESMSFDVTLNQYPAGDNLGGGPAGDMIVWFQFGSTISFAAGDTVTLSGAATVSPITSSGKAKAGPPAAVSAPTAGIYQAYLISSQNGAEISQPMSLQVNVVPEPASGALAVLSISALLLRRKRS